MYLLIPFKHGWEKRICEIQAIPGKKELSAALEYDLFEKEYPDLMKYALETFEPGYLYITREFVVKASKIFPPLRYTLYCKGAMMVKPHQIPNGICNRIELADIFLQKALSYPFSEEQTPYSVFALATIALYSFQLAKVFNPQMFLKFAVIMAKEIGLNTEEGIEKLSIDPKEQEGFRRIWWFTYNVCAYLWQHNEDIIEFHDQKLLLPRLDLSTETYYGLEIMQNKLWFTPSFSIRDFYSLRGIMCKITIQIHNYVFGELCGQIKQGLYIIGSIIGSLNEWNQSAKLIFDTQDGLLRQSPNRDSEINWPIIFMRIHYLTQYINLINPRILKTILKKKPLKSELFYAVALNASMEITQILTSILKVPDSFKDFDPYFAVLVFESAVILLLSAKAYPYIESHQTCFDLHCTVLQMHAIRLEREPTFYKILQKLKVLGLEDLTLKYGEFKAANWHINSQPPKKRKCTRGHPCALCLDKNVKCTYSFSKTELKDIEDWDSRIRKLETLLIVPSRTWKQDIKPQEVVYTSVELEHYLFSQDHDDLLQLAFDKIDQYYYFVSEDYLRFSAKQFWPLRFILYSAGAMFTTNIPAGVTRIEMANLYLDKALSFPFIQELNVLSVLTVSLAVLAFFRLQRPGGHDYLQLAINLAKNIGLNSEVGIAKLSPFDYERENYRRQNEDIIVESDLKCFLPAHLTFHGKQDQHGMGIMASREWFTGSIPNLNLQAYRILLAKIQIRINKFIHELLTKELNSELYVFGCIIGSLKEWYVVYEPISSKSKFEIKANRYQDWMIVYNEVHYHHLYVTTIFPLLLQDVIQRKKIQKKFYYQQALDITLNNAETLLLIIQYNPTLKHINTYIANMILEPAIFLLISSKINPKKETQKALNIHLKILELHGKALQREPLFLELILYLTELSLENIAILFGEFRANDSHLTLQRPINLDFHKLKI
ncbi:hypothetical protein HDV01_001051 [Terramyces sp. JEL0728]|nr:hypothetical protein HDV01_001051 [Terramyces sp. JEL0728]